MSTHNTVQYTSSTNKHTFMCIYLYRRYDNIRGFVASTHCPKNNLNLCIKTSNTFTAGADAYGIYLAFVLAHIGTEIRHILVASAPTVTDFFSVAVRIFLGQCTSLRPERKPLHNHFILSWVNV